MKVCESEIYRGYNEKDIEDINTYSVCNPKIEADYYTDGFGVKTAFECVPFVQPNNLIPERIKLPVPDDGFHAETIEYFALVDSIKRTVSSEIEYCAVEFGAGWGPWITASGIIARNNGIKKISLIGVEAHTGRYELMQKHLRNNQFKPIEWNPSMQKKHLEQCALVFNGVIWGHDGEVFFPQNDITDMGTSASNKAISKDYRGHRNQYESVSCLTPKTLCKHLSKIHFLHIDIQGAEYEILKASINWLNKTVVSIMVATHSRVIEGQIIALLLKNNWTLLREKPCRVDWQRTQGDLEGWTTKDGSQYWVNQIHN